MSGNKTIKSTVSVQGKIGHKHSFPGQNKSKKVQLRALGVKEKASRSFVILHFANKNDNSFGTPNAIKKDLVSCGASPYRIFQTLSIKEGRVLEVVHDADPSALRSFINLCLKADLTLSPTAWFANTGRDITLATDFIKMAKNMGRRLRRNFGKTAAQRKFISEWNKLTDTKVEYKEKEYLFRKYYHNEVDDEGKSSFGVNEI